MAHAHAAPRSTSSHGALPCGEAEEQIPTRIRDQPEFEVRGRCIGEIPPAGFGFWKEAFTRDGNLASRGEFRQVRRYFNIPDPDFQSFHQRPDASLRCPGRYKPTPDPFLKWYRAEIVLPVQRLPFWFICGSNRIIF
jgi:hypothetical protein